MGERRWEAGREGRGEFLQDNLVSSTELVK